MSTVARRRLEIGAFQEECDVLPLHLGGDYAEADWRADKVDVAYQNIPLAIRAGNKDVRRAWGAWMRRSLKWSWRTGYDEARAIMADTNIRDSVQRRCYEYHLLLARMNEMKSSKWVEENLSSDQGHFWFVEGLRYMYANRDWQARESFAKGMFAQAALTRKDYARLQKVGVPVQWKGGGDNVLESSLSLARQFVEMPLEMKKKVVNTGIGGKKLTDDQLLDVYWNAGFLLLSERGNSNNDIYMSLTKNLFYESANRKLEIHSASISLVSGNWHCRLG